MRLGYALILDGITNTILAETSTNFMDIEFGVPNWAAISIQDWVKIGRPTAGNLPVLVKFRLRLRLQGRGTVIQLRGVYRLVNSNFPELLHMGPGIMGHYHPDSNFLGSLLFTH